MRRFESSRQSRVFDFSALQILPPVPSVSHALLGPQFQSKVSGQVIFVGRKNSLFAQPKRFAHNGLAFSGLCQIARNLRAFSRVLMWDVRSLPPVVGAIAQILACGLWALQTRSWRRPEL